MDGMKHSDRKRRTGAKAGARGEIGLIVQPHMGNFPMNHGVPDGRMQNFTVGVHALDPAVDKFALIVKKAGQRAERHITVFIKGSGEYTPAVIPEELRKIGPAPEK